jgi:hypothetical protein
MERINMKRATQSKAESKPRVKKTKKKEKVVVPSPWLTVWFHPRETIRVILKNDIRYGFIPIAAVIGFLGLLARAKFHNLGETYSLLTILLGCVLLAIPVGIAGIYIQGAILSGISREFGGKSNAQETRAVIIWANVPLFITLVLYIYGILFMGQNIFLKEIPLEQKTILGGISLVIIGFGQVLCSIWAICLLIAGLAEVHRFTILRSSTITLSLTSIWLVLYLLFRLVARMAPN